MQFILQDEHINTVTKEFCDWVSSLGGESNNIEESTITSLFASGYETKPALSVPIHVVELTNVPMELRNSANVPAPPEENKKVDATEGPVKKKDWVNECFIVYCDEFFEIFLYPMNNLLSIFIFIYILIDSG